MGTTTSADGTKIAFDVAGSGPPLIIVAGAMLYRELPGPTGPLAAELKRDFTVFTYDRRGRGETPAGEFSPQREIEDIAALVKEAGGTAHLFGASAGAMLALEAANAGIGVTRLAIYEPPLIVDGAQEPMPDSYLAEMRQLVAEGRRREAVLKFWRLIGEPEYRISMRWSTPAWQKMEAVAHTLPNDVGLLAEFQRGKPLPKDRWTSTTMPTLVAAGSKSPAHARKGMAALAEVLPNATYVTVPGLTHTYKATVLGPVLKEFLAGNDEAVARLVAVPDRIGAP
jgi:pimeloyl-ACP methyl ester carboxylesterase